MILPENTKNIKEVVETIYLIPLKRAEYLLDDDKFDEWIKKMSDTLEFDFTDFL